MAAPERVAPEAYDGLPEEFDTAIMSHGKPLRVDAHRQLREAVAHSRY